MSDLVLHPSTKLELENFIDSPSHALLLIGPSGSGKYSVAVDLAEVLLQIRPGKLTTHAYTRVISPLDNKSIGIDSVRELEHFLSLKVPNAQQIRRAVIIADAHLMTIEAQNALLKTLEEPPEGTILILTVANEQSLLPTISSRAQKIAVKSPVIQELERYLKEHGISTENITKALAMSGGLAGLSVALAKDDDHPLRQAATKARQILGESTFDRLAHLDELTKQKDLCNDTLFVMQQMAAISLRKATGAAAKRWQAILSKSFDAQLQLSNGAQAKLVLVDLLLGI